MLKSKLLRLLLVLVLPVIAHAEQYQSQESFLQEAFSESIPQPKVLWIDKDRKTVVADILQHPPGFLRTRYWQQHDRSVWILQEIGKTKPITVGVLIEKHKIVSLRVLAFHESRGWEVKHDFFTDQFKQIELDEQLRLNRPIDGIAGATLSVKALRKIATLALYFDRLVTDENP